MYTVINHLIPKVGFANAVRATAYIVVGCLIAANSLMRNNSAIYGLRVKADPLNILGFFTDIPYVVGIFGYMQSSMELANRLLSTQYG
ncbi:hypothetical protein H0H92_015548 [Tricholoma furcatifolium]|nr:hypothetical protein H0H92_015548 [Tricholoma furcatifolium]